MYMYIYIYIKSTPSASTPLPPFDRRGTDGVGTNGVTTNLMFFDRGTFSVLPLTYFCLPKSARVYLFPQSVKLHYVCSGHISVDAICPQPIRAQLATALSTTETALFSSSLV